MTATRNLPSIAPSGGRLMLHEFIAEQHDELIERARAKLASRPAPRATNDELANGVPLFLTQLGNILKQEAAQSAPDGAEMGLSATQHGSDLLQQGFSIAQVVHDYGDVCQAITELALDLRIPIATEDFHTLNRCLDNAIASAVTEYARQRDVDVSGAEVERQGFFAHELRNHLNTAMLAFQVVKSGKVGVTGSTIGVLDRSLRGLRDLIDRSVSEVRLAAGTHQQGAASAVADFIEEMEIDASMEATDRGLQFSVERRGRRFARGRRPASLCLRDFEPAAERIQVHAARGPRAGSEPRSTATRVSIEVEDECGGLPPGAAEALFRPFEQGEQTARAWAWAWRSAARPSRPTAARSPSATSPARAVRSS